MEWLGESSVNKEIKPPSGADMVVATRQIEQGTDTESDGGEGPRDAPGEGTWGRVGQREWGGPAGEGGEAGGRRTRPGTGTQAETKPPEALRKVTILLLL